MRNDSWDDIPILQAHALHPSTDPNFNHARSDLIRNVDACLQARAALSIDAFQCRRLGETSDQSGRTEFSCSTTRRKYIAYSDVLDQVGIDL